MTIELVLALDAAEGLSVLADEVRRIRRAIQDAVSRSPDGDFDAEDAGDAAYNLKEAEDSIALSVRRIGRLRQRGKVVKSEREGEPQ